MKSCPPLEVRAVNTLASQDSNPHSSPRPELAVPLAPNAEAAMCPNVPSHPTPMCGNVPSPGTTDGTESAEICTNVHESAATDVENAVRRTNPIPREIEPQVPPSKLLSYVQLAATRLIVHGYGSNAVARQLGLNPHTIGRWKHDPRFIAEIERLRAHVTALAVAPARSAPSRIPNGRRPSTITAPPSRPAPSRKSDAEDDRECEAMIERILSKARPTRPSHR
jgi:hypothetical protein